MSGHAGLGNVVAHGVFSKLKLVKSDIASILWDIGAGVATSKVVSFFADMPATLINSFRNSTGR